MIEFNIQWCEDSKEELEQVIRLIKEADLSDVKINITRSSVLVEHKARKSFLPDNRVKQIVDAFHSSGKTSLTKPELITLLAKDGALSESTASTYISTAAGQGILNRNFDGYVLGSLSQETES